MEVVPVYPLSSTAVWGMLTDTATMHSILLSDHANVYTSDSTIMYQRSGE